LPPVPAVSPSGMLAFADHATMLPKTGINSAEASAVRGIRQAHNLADRAAAAVVQAGAEANQFGNAASVSISSAGKSIANASAPNSRDLPNALVDLMRAEHVQGANVKVLQTASDMQRELSNMLSRK